MQDWGDLFGVTRLGCEAEVWPIMSNDGMNSELLVDVGGIDRWFEKFEMGI